MRIFNAIRKCSCGVVLAFAIGGCASKNEETVEEVTEPNTLFNEAVKLTNKDHYLEAISKFETLEREHPESPLAAQSKIRKAYAYYEDGNYIFAVNAIDEFVKQYPSHSNAPYMFYLKGLCYYDQIVDPGRDQELTHKAIEAFEDLLNRYPDSKYAKDAQFKIDYAVNNLAGKEMNIGNFYQGKNQLVAALNRYKNVVDKYQTSIFVAEALYRLVEIYYALGDIDQAKVYASVLQYNYPKSEWHEKSYALIVDKNYVEQKPWYKKPIKSIW